MNIRGTVIDWTEAIAGAEDDPESRPAGSSEPAYHVSDEVTFSRDNRLIVYHLPDDQLGQGSSLGNSGAWAETKGNGDMLGLFSIEAGEQITGGMSVTYLLPFDSISTYGSPLPKSGATARKTLSRAMPSSTGTIHLHPAFQQRGFVIGDGLHVLETFFLPRTNSEDPDAAHQVVSLKNQTPHPVEIRVVVSLALRGRTERDIQATYDGIRNALVAWNKSRPDWVRVLGSPDGVIGHWATTDEEEAYNPSRSFPNSTSDTGDLVGALQFKVLLYPGAHKKIRAVVAFSPHGRNRAIKTYDQAIAGKESLKKTIAYYRDTIGCATVEMPDETLTHGIQWAKACLVRPVAEYPIGTAATNDPGNSTHIVGRDTAWYSQGCDFVRPEWSCSMLSILARHQRSDGLIAEYIDGNTGEVEYHGVNINDNTPLFILAVAHHIKATAHWSCGRELYIAARKAGELILKQRDKRGLVTCTSRGLGVVGICGWRNVLQNQEITGAVTEVNAECHAALRSLGDLAETMGDQNDAKRYRAEAQMLKDRINQHLINPENGLYVLNIDLDGSVYTQVTCDNVFPLIFGVADPDTANIVTARLSQPDFMTDAGLRVLPSENPKYDPSFESGCMGGVWHGVTWWYAVSAAGSDPMVMADSLRRAYAHYVQNPKVYNTVPGQFSEWSDGQTLVNRGMRLSPWDSPRFIWAAIEGLAGVQLELNSIVLKPQIPVEWRWLRVHNVRYRDGTISFFLAREGNKLVAYTANSFGGNVELRLYEEEMDHPPEAITTRVTASAFRKPGEIIICLGSSSDTPALGPFLAHHSIDSTKRYRVLTRASHLPDWEDLGIKNGRDLQRIVVRLDKRGYAVYRFLEQPARGYI